jgi:serine O-acetyltransferase
LYQGVTLGGTGKEKGKRHPTIGNNVFISSGAKVMGSFKVGDNSKIGANSVVLAEVPPNSTVVGVKARIVKRDGVSLNKLDHDKLSDPVIELFRNMEKQIEDLKTEVERLQEEVQRQNGGVQSYESKSV